LQITQAKYFIKTVVITVISGKAMGKGQKPPNFLLVGSGAKSANHHAAFAPAIFQRAKSHKRRKNPGTPPLEAKAINCWQAQWELKAVSPPGFPPSHHVMRNTNGFTTGCPYTPAAPFLPNSPTPGTPR